MSASREIGKALRIGYLRILRHEKLAKGVSEEKIRDAIDRRCCPVELCDVYCCCCVKRRADKGD